MAAAGRREGTVHMGWLGSWLMGKLKWLLVIAAIGGPFFAYTGWTDVDRVNDVLAKGVEGDARIVSAVRKKGRRSGTSFYVNLAWKDASGADRKVEDIRVSNALSGKLFQNDRFDGSKPLKIKYLADASDKDGVVIVDDARESLELDRFMMWGGAIVGLIGLFGCALVFGWFGRLRSKPNERLAGDARAPMGPPAS